MSKKALFLDRDGVINRQIVGDYVRSIEQFEILDGVLEAICNLSSKFDYIFIVTNQQGIGKGLFSKSNLEKIHSYFLEKVRECGGKIDKIYVCPDLEKDESINRKPSPGMALQAKVDFPDLNFENSVMVGDTYSDMLFGKNLNMTTALITNNKELDLETLAIADQTFSSLLSYSLSL